MNLKDQIYLTSCSNEAELAPMENYEGDPNASKVDDYNVVIEVESNLSKPTIQRKEATTILEEQSLEESNLVT